MWFSYAALTLIHGKPQKKAGFGSFKEMIMENQAPQNDPLPFSMVDAALGGMAVFPNSSTSAAQPLYQQSRPTLAIDLDEVLGQFVFSLSKWHNAIYGTSYTVQSFHSYTFRYVWGGTELESREKVHRFLASPEFKSGIPPIPGAYESLRQLKEQGYRLVLVTSRQAVIESETRQWIKQNFPDLFDDILLGNHWAKLDGGQSTGQVTTDNANLVGIPSNFAPLPNQTAAPSKSYLTKPEMCRMANAHVLIDDNLEYAFDCSNHGIFVYLFGNQPWNQFTPYHPSHPSHQYASAHEQEQKHMHPVASQGSDEHLPMLISRVQSWEELVRKIVDQYHVRCLAEYHSKLAHPKYE